MLFFKNVKHSSVIIKKFSFITLHFKTFSDFKERRGVMIERCLVAQNIVQRLREKKKMKPLKV